MPPGICRTWWDYMTVQHAVLPKNKGLEGKTVGEIAKTQGKGIIDAFLDLVVEENLDTAFLHGENNVDDEAVAKILNYPNAIIGLSDGGAHVQFQSGFGFSTRLLGEWVREKQIMSLETRGAAADLRIGLDLRPVRPRPAAAGHGGRYRDLRSRHGAPAAARGRARLPDRRHAHQEPAQGIHMTVVNGQVLLEDGKHSGALPGRVLRNTYYRANHQN